MRNWVVRVLPFWAAELLHYYFSWNDFTRGEHGGIEYTILKCIPVVVLLLMSLAYFKKDGRFRTLHSAGIFFSLIGDILLAYRSESKELFAVGTVAFAFSQFCYIKTFCNVGNLHRPSLVLFAGFNVVFGALTHEPLEKEPASLRLALMGYAPILSFAAWSSVSEYIARSGNDKGTGLRMFGYFTYLVSDLLIAIDAFIYPIYRSQLPVIVTYYLAQLLIFMANVTVEEAEEKLKKKH